MNESRDIKLTLNNPHPTIDHEKSTLNKDKDLSDPNRENSILTNLEGYRSTFEDGDRSGGSELTSLDPKEKNSRSQFSADKDKELSDLSKEKSILTDQKCPVDFSEGGDRSGGSELTLSRP